MSGNGNRKAQCERILRASEFPYTIIRPALVYGSYDKTDRLYYWIDQIQREEKLVLLENGKRKFSMTYGKDVGQLILKALKSKKENQVFNCISTTRSSIDWVVKLIEEHSGKSANKTSVSAEQLKANDINEWTDIPLWLSSDAFTYSNQKAINEIGFKPTSLDLGIHETLDYFKQLDFPNCKFSMTDCEKHNLLDAIEANKIKSVA